MDKFLEIISVAGIFLFLLGPALFFKQWWLALVFGVFGLCFGIIEGLSVKFSGLSVSQHVWVLKETNPIQVYIIVAGMIISWGLLIFHFLNH